MPREATPQTGGRPLFLFAANKKIMPYSGIKPGSSLEKKIEKCVSMIIDRQGGDKSRAIAICRSSIQKTKETGHTPPQYRNAGPASTKICQTCKAYNNGRCSTYKTTVNKNYLCNSWLPNIKALQERGRQLTKKQAHGPGGLYSTLGQSRGIINASSIIPNPKRKKRKKRTTKSRSRGAAEQRAMFAKMGASGSLQAKGPDGKRTGPKMGGGERKPEVSGPTIKKPLEVTGKLISTETFNGLPEQDRKRLIEISESAAVKGHINMLGPDQIARLSPNQLKKHQERNAEYFKLSLEVDKLARSIPERQAAAARQNIKKLQGRQLQINRRIRDINTMLSHKLTSKRNNPTKREYQELLQELTTIQNQLSNITTTKQTNGRYTTKARSRGGPELRAMFAKMGTAGTAYPRSGGKRMSPKQVERQETQKWLDSISSGGGNVEDQILPPKGPAPRGKGREYQTRRWIHNRINKFERRKAELRSATASDRGTKRDRQRLSRNKIAIDSINQSLEVARHVIQNLIDAGEDFAPAKDLFSELFSMPAALLGGL